MSDLHFEARLLVDDRVFLSAILLAGSPVCRGIVRVQAQIAFARYGHAKGPVTKDLDLHKSSRRALDLLLLDLLCDLFHLSQAEFPAQYYGIRKHTIELQGLDVGHIDLG